MRDEPPSPARDSSPRAINRLAMFAHAMRRTSPVIANNMNSAGPASLGHVALSTASRRDHDLPGEESLLHRVTHVPLQRRLDLANDRLIDGVHLRRAPARSSRLARVARTRRSSTPCASSLGARCPCRASAPIASVGVECRPRAVRRAVELRPARRRRSSSPCRSPSASCR